MQSLTIGFYSIRNFLIRSKAPKYKTSLQANANKTTSHDSDFNTCTDDTKSKFEFMVKIRQWLIPLTFNTQLSVLIRVQNGVLKNIYASHNLFCNLNVIFSRWVSASLCILHSCDGLPRAPVTSHSADVAGFFTIKQPLGEGSPEKTHFLFQNVSLYGFSRCWLWRPCAFQTHPTMAELPFQNDNCARPEETQRDPIPLTSAPGVSSGNMALGLTRNAWH